MDYIQVKLGGKQRGLKFNMGTFRFIGELTGKDPLRFEDSSNDLGEQYRIIKTIIHAGLLSNCISKKIEPDFDDGNVNEWVSELSAAEGVEVIEAFRTANQTVPEENKKKAAK